MMDLYITPAQNLSKIAQMNVHYPGGVPEGFNPEATPAAAPAAGGGQPGEAAKNALKTMYQSFQRFRDTFNPQVQLIEAGRQQIVEAYKALTQVDWGNSMVDEQQIVQQAGAVQQLLDRATQEESQDTAFLQQLSSQMGQLGQMVGQRGVTGDIQMSGAPAEPTPAPASPGVPPGAAPGAPAPPAAPKGPGAWQRMKNLWNMTGQQPQPAVASDGSTILTAGMGSALYK